MTCTRSFPTIVLAFSCGLVGLVSFIAVAGADDAAAVGASPSPSDQAPVTETLVAETPTVEAGCCRRSGCGSLGALLRPCRVRARLRAIVCRPRVCCKPACRCGSKNVTKGDAAKPDPLAWRELFDGKTLDGWKVPEFGGDGEVFVEDGAVILSLGSAMTGITYTGDVPRDNYELEWEGARLDGIDFFATATFPVGEDECSFVTGGWGGMVAGLSSIDYYDASDNMTTSFQEFKDDQWYKFRVRVTPAKIEVWIGDQQVVDQKREGHKIGIRDEVDLCRPLGISSYATKGGTRNIRIRLLKPAEK